MRERDVEQYLVRRVKEAGGIAYKFTSPGRRSVPDRIVLWPHGDMEFVELKAPGQKPTPLQAREHEKLRKLGYLVSVLDSIDAVRKWLGDYE
jgi:hypothetical protein